MGALGHLKCHKSHENVFTEGQTYKIIEKKDSFYIIEDDISQNHMLTIKTDGDGLYYKTWFDLI